MYFQYLYDSTHFSAWLFNNESQTSENYDSAELDKKDFVCTEKHIFDRKDLNFSLEPNGKLVEKTFDLNYWIKEILYEQYGKEVPDEVINTFIIQAFSEGSILATKKEVIDLFEKYEGMQEEGLPFNEKVNTIFLDEQFFEQLTTIEQLNHLRKLIYNIESMEINSEEEIIEVRRNGKTKQILVSCMPLYKKYLAMAKNLKKKLEEEIEEISIEDETTSNYKNSLGRATLAAEEKLEAEKFGNVETLEEVYEKICKLKKQKNRDEKTELKIKIYKNKLSRLAHRKNVMLFMKWQNILNSSLILSKLKNPMDLLPKLHFLTIQPEKFMKSKNISDKVKEQIVADAIHLFEGISEEEFIEKHKRELEYFKRLLSKRREKTFEVSKKREPVQRKNLEKR